MPLNVEQDGNKGVGTEQKMRERPTVELFCHLTNDLKISENAALQLCYLEMVRYELHTPSAQFRTLEPPRSTELPLLTPEQMLMRINALANS